MTGAGLVTLRWLDPEAPARQAAYRSRHKHPDEMCGLGNRPGSWRALARINKLLVVCGAPGCAALCAYARALRDARRAGRDAIEPVDGCAACSQETPHATTFGVATATACALALAALADAIILASMTISGVGTLAALADAAIILASSCAAIKLIRPSFSSSDLCLSSRSSLACRSASSAAAAASSGPLGGTPTAAPS